jgi:hypothetical protein
MRTAMDRLKGWLPILTAFLSAMGVLVGYLVGSYEKEMDRSVELRKTRQEIYTALISNVTEKNILLGRFLLSPEYLKTNPENASN